MISCTGKQFRTQYGKTINQQTSTKDYLLSGSKLPICVKQRASMVLH